MENINSFIFLSILSTTLLLLVDNKIHVESSAILIDRSGKLHENFVHIEDKQYPAKEFSNYSIVQPIIYHGREKRELTHKISYYNINNLTVVLPNKNEELILDLILNAELIPKGYFRQTQENGTYRIEKFDTKEVELCHYRGKIRNKPDSWVALSTCDGLSGVIFDGDHMSYIEKVTKGNENEHFLYSDKNLIGYKEKENPNYRNKRYSRRSRRSIKRPWNANTDSRYVELILVVDNGKYQEMNKNLKNVEDFCKNIVNIMNGLYFPLNIFIALVGVVVWTEHDEIEISEDGYKTLKNFLRYRREKLNREHPNDNAQLFVKSTFTGGVVGKALSGPICTSEFSGGVNSGYSSVVGITAGTVTHMLGHNFGMEHDTEDCECPDQRCIMSSQTPSTALTHWSSCSRRALEQAFEHGMDHCLKNIPSSIFQSPTCGNGFLENGEECDCGLPDYCSTNCCNPATCKLRENATCATGECCDLEICKFKKPGKLCRQVTNECDLPEYCTGDGEYCFPDVYKMDTTICGSGNSYCYQGRCNSHFHQCRLIWGTVAERSHDECYKLNVKGNRHGNCGYKPLNKSYEKCNAEDVLCGMLHCRLNDPHNTVSFNYGLESVSILSKSFINFKGSILSCKSAVIDLGLNDPDPGMVPNGAACGDGKMCLNQKCVSVATLQEGRTCPHNCYNNGWCNNRGHCHCKIGYLLPFCQYLSGGSVDSGPPEEEGNLRNQQHLPKHSPSDKGQIIQK